MTDLSVTHPSTYALMTAACWAVPALALVWGVIYLVRSRPKLCGERYDFGPTLWATYRCTRRSHHRGAHHCKGFAWVEGENPR